MVSATAIGDGASYANSAASNLTSITTSSSAPIPVPAPLQQSSISSISPASVTAGSTASATISGNFAEKITNITVNGRFLPIGGWTQTPSTVTLSIPTGSTGTVSIQIYNGSAPVLAAQTVQVVAAPPAVVAAAPVKQKVIYVHCYSGNKVRISYGVAPVCPAGYSQR
jgi:hypothetical protein